MSQSSLFSKQFTMFNPSEISQTATNLFSTYASLAGSIMLLRSMAHELIPPQVMSYLTRLFQYFFTHSNTVTLVVDESIGMTRNQVFDAAEIYLRTKISPKTGRIKVGKTPRQKQISLEIEKGEEIVDSYDNIELKWKLVLVESERRQDKRFFELTFNKKFKNKIVDSYLPYILLESDSIKREERAVRLYSRDLDTYDDEETSRGSWGSVNLEHPSKFETLAMDLEMKKMIIDDLDRFLRRKEFYKRVGKAWKRGYLLYGPPGTGKSSLIAAMANYLKFDVYDLELTSVYGNSDLRNVLLSTTNRSILVIEDIDCSAEVKDRDNESNDRDSSKKLTLSGILNVVDGLWSSCGDERIIIFTTNHKDRLDPALLRPGRMDVHIHLSYCTVEGFRILATNYLGDHCLEHSLCQEIEGLILKTEVTPAEIAEELMKNDNVDIAMQGLVSFLVKKNTESKETSDKVMVKKSEMHNKFIGEKHEIVETNKDDDEKGRRISETVNRKRRSRRGRRQR